MIPAQIDFIFPFVVFFYGALLTFVLSQPRLMTLAEERLPPAILSQMRAHRVLAWTSLVTGFFWSLQNLWQS
ncbi:MAG: hypothetical protein IT288_04625 [Bdellovibrionales bacterium]|nr:hypothetical protein [Bdellovibrionales bacterium]